MINNGKIFDKYMTISEKVNIMKNKEYSEKKDNSEMIYSKIYLKAEKRFNTKESFQCFYIPLILFDSVYRKDGNYNPKVLLKNLFITFFGEVE